MQAAFRVCILAGQAQVQAEALAADVGLAKGCVAGLPNQLARGIGSSLGRTQVVGVQPDDVVTGEPDADDGLQVVAYVCNGRRVGLVQCLAFGRVDHRNGLVGQIEVLAGELTLRVELSNELLVVVQKALRLIANRFGNPLAPVVVVVAGKRFVLLSDGDELAQCVPYIFTLANGLRLAVSVIACVGAVCSNPVVATRLVTDFLRVAVGIFLALNALLAQHPAILCVVKIAADGLG